MFDFITWHVRGSLDQKSEVLSEPFSHPSLSAALETLLCFVVWKLKHHQCLLF